MKNEKNVYGRNIKGFTLIEVLVVVLIIGILAAIAVPQYNLAVAKTRISALMPLLRSLQQAQERYSMANGSYAKTIRNLDVTCASYGTSEAYKDWCYLDKKGRVSARLDEGRYIFATDSRVPGVSLLFFYRGKESALCYAWDSNEEFANRVCRSLTGLDEPSGRINGANTYRLFQH